MDLEAYGTESACSHHNIAAHANQGTTTHAGSAKLPDIFRTKSWAVARPLTAPRSAVPVIMVRNGVDGRSNELVGDGLAARRVGADDPPDAFWTA